MPQEYAKYKTGDDAKNADVVHDAEDEMVEEVVGQDFPITQLQLRLNGKPFSAVHRSVVITYFDEPPENFDEFGFRKVDVEEESRLLQEPLEISQYRMKWLAHLQFKHSKLDSELTWNNLNVNAINDAKTTELIKEGGIPHSMRAFLWPRFCSATTRRKASNYGYPQIVAEASEEAMIECTQIERDLLRTLPNNRCFSKDNAPGIAALRRVLTALAYFYPELGYCQGMGTVVATLLLVCDEVDTFWMMCKLIENYLPSNFYGDNLLGLQAEVKLLEHLIDLHMPEIGEKIRNSDTEISIILANWLLTLAASVVPIRILLRIWDMVFQQGISALYRAILSMFKMNEELMLNSDLEEKATGIFSFIQEIPSSVDNVDYLIEFMTTFEFSITEETIQRLRKTYQGSIMAQNGLIYQTNANLPKQQVATRKLKDSKSSFISNMFASIVEEDPKTKNVRQTELIIDLKNSVYQMCNHFRACPEGHEVITQVDYSADEKFNQINQKKMPKRQLKRARALIDFLGKEDDELSFKRNDIITIVTEREEHCWVGELNGFRGWFPAKFVKVVEEAGKGYCIWGDESITPRVGNLVRNTLASAIAAILNYGLKPTGIITGTITHPWHFIEVLATRLMEAHSNITHSKLTLCDTFSLDQDTKVLSPEELLFRAVHTVMESHGNPTIKNDVRFRSWVAIGLNEQCLHRWFEVLCSSDSQESLRQAYYQDWAFIRSPVWKQITYELRLLSQFSFNLNIDFEVEQVSELERLQAEQRGFVATTSITQRTPLTAPLALSFYGKKENTIGGPPLKEGVRDMLIKHNLFSWDL
ncbi:RUN and TBC1 domain-containing protein 3 [Aphelenchoides besseyi]|nr:RUN and TBC1 domain-containing protein 3 [Aphelenchoides besseyi]KAI6200843.1 RUN and TBC1 domain-containing protein 3 [Aphelenchoides besseyi]